MTERIIYAYYLQLPYYPKKYFIAVNHDTPLCPACNGTLKVRDSKHRTVIDSEGKKIIFSLRRLYCPNCKKLHIELPDCIEPQKHYYKSVIDSVRSGNVDNCPADNKTIYRWKK